MRIEKQISDSAALILRQSEIRIPQSTVAERVCVDSGRAVGDEARAGRALVELHGADAAYDRVSITQLAQAPQRCEQQRAPQPAPALACDTTRRPEEVFARALVAREAHEPPLAQRDEDRRRLSHEPARNLVGP